VSPEYSSFIRSTGLLIRLSLQYRHVMAPGTIQYHPTVILLAFFNGGTLYSLTLPRSSQTAQCAAPTPHTLASATHITYPIIRIWSSWNSMLTILREQSLIARLVYTWLTSTCSDRETIENFELLVRSILLRDDQPAIVILGHFSPQVHQTSGFGGPDIWHNIVAQFYDVPHVRCAFSIL